MNRGLRIQARAITRDTLKPVFDLQPLLLLRSVYERRMPPLLRRLGEQPGAPVYPIRWTSERQRRYVMALLRANDNLPYRRTGQLSRSWKHTLRLLPQSGIITVFSGVPYARYVTGGLDTEGDNRYTPQQEFHRRTGWRPAQPVIREAYRDIYDDVLRGWTEQLRRNAAGFNVRIRSGF